MSPLPQGVRVLGKIRHRELPGYCEDFCLQRLDALAAGLSIIATEATAAPNLILRGAEGLAIPVGDVEALRDALQRFIASPDDIKSMSPAARRCAERYSWDACGDRRVDLLLDVARSSRFS